MKKIILILLIFLIASCGITRKQANKKLDKIQRQQPVSIMEKCASLYNPTDSIREVIRYKEGETKIKYIKIKVNCDSLKQLQLLTEFIYVDVPITTRSVDTIFKDILKITSNKAKEEYLRYQRDSVLKAIVITQDRLQRNNKMLRIMWIGIIGLIIAALIVFIIKLYSKFKS